MHATLRDPEPPLTRSVEDYLKAIYHLSSQGGFEHRRDIAGCREAPLAGQMVDRLQVVFHRPGKRRVGIAQRWLHADSFCREGRSPGLGTRCYDNELGSIAP